MRKTFAWTLCISSVHFSWSAARKKERKKERKSKDEIRLHVAALCVAHIHLRLVTKKVFVFDDTELERNVCMDFLVSSVHFSWSAART